MSEINQSQKVLFVTHKHPPSIGGMQKQSYELVRNYQKIEDISLIHYTSSYPIWIFFIIVIPWVLLKILSDRKISIIHANDGLMGLFLTPFLLFRKKLFVTIHGLDIVYNISAYQWWIRNFLVRFDGIIAVSQQTADECLARGIHSKKVIYIPNAVDPPLQGEKDPEFIKWLEENYDFNLVDNIIISSVGRPIPRKGFSWFACNVLPSLPENAIYTIVGPKEGNEGFYSFLSKILSNSLFKKFCQFNGIGMDYFELKELIKDPRIGGKIRLLGKLSQHHLDQLYMHTDIFIMPNLKVVGDYEGFGLVAQEAVYNGALCVAANIDGIPSAIEHEKTGILLPSGNIEAWITTLSGLIGNKLKLKEKALAYQRNIRTNNYTWMDMTKKYHAYFLGENQP